MCIYCCWYWCGMRILIHSLSSQWYLMASLSPRLRHKYRCQLYGDLLRQLCTGENWKRVHRKEGEGRQGSKQRRAPASSEEVTALLLYLHQAIHYCKRATWGSTWYLRRSLAHCSLTGYLSTQVCRVFFLVDFESFSACQAFHWEHTYMRLVRSLDTLPMIVTKLDSLFMVTDLRCECMKAGR